ncbi:MAG: hypothetical protein OHK0039_01280 [Bacteroidia bacterium]
MVRSHSKLYRLLRSLSGSECRLLDAFLAAEYHNRSARVQDFWTLVRDWFPVAADESPGQAEARAAALDKAQLFAQLFPGQPYRDSNISNLMTQVAGAVEEFLVHEALRRQPLLRQRLLLQELRSREGLAEDFRRRWQSLQPEIEAAAQTSTESMYLALAFQEDWLAYQAEYQPRSEETALPESLALLKRFVLILNLKYYLATLNRRRLAGGDLDSALQEYLWQYLEADPALGAAPPLRVYHLLIRCLLHPGDVASYARLRQIFEDDTAGLSPGETRTLYYTTLNYLNGRLKGEGEDVLPELLYFYRSAYDRGLLFNGAFIDANVYLNILNVVSGVIRRSTAPARQQLEAWRDTFVADNLARLRPDIREETHQYARAYLAYQHGRHAEAFRILSSYKHTDIISDISRRMLLVRVYYDAWDIELLDSQVKSALMYISRASAVSETKRLAYNRFVRITRKLSALRGSQTPAAELARLRADIEAPEPLECRQWLMEKCTELSERGS